MTTMREITTHRVTAADDRIGLAADEAEGLPSVYRLTVESTKRGRDFTQCIFFRTGDADPRSGVITDLTLLAVLIDRQERSPESHAQAAALAYLRRAMEVLRRAPVAPAAETVAGYEI